MIPMKSCLILLLTLLTRIPLLAEESLPAPWKHQDIGDAKTPGAAAHAAGVFTVQGTMDLWGVADGCQIVSQPIHGDGALVVRVTAIDNPGGVAHAKAGVCI